MLFLLKHTMLIYFQRFLKYMSGGVIYGATFQLLGVFLNFRAYSFIFPTF